MAARRARRRNGTSDTQSSQGATGASRWMISYSDFMTLLFVVFMVLFSAARFDSAKYAAIAEAFQQYMGRTGAGGGLAPLPTGSAGGEGQATPIIPGEGGGTEPAEPDWLTRLVEPVEPEEEPAPAKAAEQTPPAQETPSREQVPTGSAGPSRKLTDSMSELAEAFQVLPGARSGILSVALQERGLVISIAGSVLFAPGEVTLKPDARAYLDDIARKLQNVELPIMVEGTADREGSSSPGGYSPWDLAALRAGAVVNYFVQHHGIPGSRFVTIGYGSAEAAERPPDMVTIVVLRKAQ